jgi:glycosyltransferase involved in cell wall biosynthesis
MLKIFGQHSENSSVGAYRMWRPFHWLRKKQLADAQHLPVEKDMYFAIQKDDPKRDPKFKSAEEWGEWADIIFRHKIWHPSQFAQAMAMRDTYKLPFVVDIDDDMLHVHTSNRAVKAYEIKSTDDLLENYIIREDQVDEYANKGFTIHNIEGQVVAWKPRPGQMVRFYTLKLIEQADAVTVSTYELKQLYSHFNKNITVIPNYIDFDRWEGITPTKINKDLIVIGWYGGASHFDDLMILNDVIPAILSKYPQARFYWCGMVPQHKVWKKLIKKYHRRLQYIQWNEDVLEWEKHFATFGFDISLAPLVDTPFNRGKSNIKWMESSMLKIPVVASNVGPYQCIKHGKTGFLASTTQEWVDSISKLVESSKLREEIAGNAYTEVKKDYNLADHAGEWLKVFEDTKRKYNLRKVHNVSGI